MTIVVDDGKGTGGRQRREAARVLGNVYPQVLEGEKQRTNKEVEKDQETHAHMPMQKNALGSRHQGLGCSNPHLSEVPRGCKDQLEPRF